MSSREFLYHLPYVSSARMLDCFGNGWLATPKQLRATLRWRHKESPDEESDFEPSHRRQRSHIIITTEHYRSTGSAVDASSQFGTDGPVEIQLEVHH